MPRTIILTLANPTPNSSLGRSEYWSLTEDGRIINGMCWDEMLGAVARVTQGTEQRFPWLTVEEYEQRARERERRQAPPERALDRASEHLKKLEDDDIPF